MGGEGRSFLSEAGREIEGKFWDALSTTPGLYILAGLLGIAGIAEWAVSGLKNNAFSARDKLKGLLDVKAVLPHSDIHFKKERR